MIRAIDTNKAWEEKDATEKIKRCDTKKQQHKIKK